MLFNSLGFLYVFLPLTYVGFWLLRSRNPRYLWLTVTGYLFYACWDSRFCLLMAFSTLVSYLAGLGFLKTTTPRARRLCLVIPITVDLLLLGFFKYADFLLTSANALSRWAGRPLDLPLAHVVVPVGISFYTFHTITYIVDCYRGVVKPTRNPFEFACYVSLFSQLVAGPIVRFREIEQDLEHLETARRTKTLDLGLSTFCIGLAKKVLLADTIAAVINPALSSYATLGSLGAWACALGYTFQLYFDFSGYSDMAVGLGHLFGIRIPRNFDSPYKATDPADFWRRWHISLSTCLRDYLYIPLGGNRGSRFATFRNLMITMTLGGLWHGANWTFLVWGAYHGVLLCLYRIFASRWDGLPAPLRRGATFLLVVVGWVLFRSDTFEMAGTLLKTMASFRAGAAVPGLGTLLALCALSAALCWGARNTGEMRHEWSALGRASWATVYALCVAVIYAGQSSPFLYFQF